MNLRIDRLALRLTGVSDGDARRIAELVARCLAGARQRGAASTAAVHLDLAARDDERFESLAERIARRIASALEKAS
jgi:phosphate uptake regulator